jgi:hypothetical protein
MHTPHTKIITISIICLALIFSTFIYTNQDLLFAQKNSEESKQDKKIILSTISEDQIVDTDKDGLKDWEETLLGTDYKKADTDGDKTLDGEEVKNGRDPRKKGPNDKLTSTTYFKENTTDTSILPQENKPNTTRDFAQAFMINYLDIKKDNPTISQQDAINIATKTISEVDIPENKQKYTIKDIILSDTETKESYRKSIEDIVYKNSPKIKLENELTIVKKALETQKQSDITKLDPIIKAYSGILTDLLKIKVPRSATGVHIVFINTLFHMNKTLKDMRNIFDDPVVGYSAIKNHQVNIWKLKAISEAYDKYFEE